MVFLYRSHDDIKNTSPHISVLKLSFIGWSVWNCNLLLVDVYYWMGPVTEIFSGPQYCISYKTAYLSGEVTVTVGFVGQMGVGLGFG
jgi:hypothetical protein